MKTKKCGRCKGVKQIEDFGVNKSSKSGYSCMCKVCRSYSNTQYSNSVKGLISKIYNAQFRSSEKRNHPPPSYSKNELKSFIVKNKGFNVMYDKWVKSDFIADLKPSIDRKNDYKPYTLCNIQLTTWGNNRSRVYLDQINGENTKQAKSVLQYSFNGIFIKEFYSMKQVERELGIHNSSVGKACMGKVKTAGGFIWKYKFL